MDARSPDRLERLRHQYAGWRPGWESATARYQRWVASALATDTRVLDLGCGRGGIVERLGRVGAWVGVDPDHISLVEHRSPQLACCCGHSGHVPYASGAFGIVVASWVLEHLQEPASAFREIARVLVPGGRFFFLTPNLLHPLVRLSSSLAHLHSLQQWLVALRYGREAVDTYPVAYRANTASAIEQLAAAVGMRLVRVEWIRDPSYLAWDNLSLVGAIGLSRLFPGRWGIHLIGELSKA